MSLVNTKDTASDPENLCPKCRAAVGDDWRFCRQCGSPVAPDGSSETTQDATIGNSSPPAFFNARSVDETMADALLDVANQLGSTEESPSAESEEDGGTIVIDCGAPSMGFRGPASGSLEPVRGRLVGASLDVEVILGDGSRFVVGRDHRTCDVVVTDSRVSREHFAISGTEGSAFLDDLGSTNGTLVNGVRVVESVPLKDGDTIKIGRIDLSYRVAQ